MLVLQYITNTKHRFLTFVANRVATIQEYSDASQWRYVNTSLNPADDATRGLSVQELTSECRWIQGPDFLRRDEEHWPKRPSIIVDLSKDMEVKRNVATSMVTTADPTHNRTMKPLWARYSSWSCLIKGVAWLMRFIESL